MIVAYNLQLPRQFPPLRASRLQSYSGGVLMYLQWKIAYRTRPGLTLPSYSGVIPSSQSQLGLSVGKVKVSIRYMYQTL